MKLNAMTNLPNLPKFNAEDILRNNGLRPDKSLGQNFLQDDSALRKIVEIAMVSPTDSVLEIGPGLGSLTRYLASSAKQVYAVELDEELLPILNTVLKGYRNVRVIQNDILKVHIPDFIQDKNYIVVANIPYYITSAILRHLLASSPRPQRIILTIQKEVAQRICAEPGDMSLLALSVQVFGKTEIKTDISASCFFPPPNVDSSVIKMDVFPEPAIPTENLDLFFKLAKAGFSQKRKTLRNSLSGGLSISSSDAERLLQFAGIDPKRRAETLSLLEWDALTKAADDLQI
jgi:16S rRNA (adenine1518-N6/adenine1519-N6)-dimethyltransferase